MTGTKESYKQSQRREEVGVDEHQFVTWEIDVRFLFPTDGQHVFFF